MGNICSSPQQLPAGSRKDPVVYKKESNKVMYEVVHADICSEKVDVLVNPTSTKLQSSEGVSQSILEKGGEKLQEEINKAMKDTEVLEISSVVVTNGGSLSVKYVIHVAMPVWRGGAEQEVEQYVQGIKNALMEADKLGAKSVAIPAVGGSGVGGFPREEVTKGLINACVEYSKETSTKTVESIKFVSSDPALVKFLQESAENTLSPKTEEHAAHPNHKGCGHVEDPKGHSPQATTDMQSEQPTSPTKEETHNHAHTHDHAHDHTHNHTHDHAHDHTHDHAHDHTHDHAHDHTHTHAHEEPKHEVASSSHEESKKEDEHHHYAEEHDHKTEEHVHHAEEHAHKTEEHAHKTEEHVHKTEEHVEEVAHKEHHEEAEKKEEHVHHEEAHHEETHHEEHHDKESKPEETQEAESHPEESEAQEAN